MPNDEDDSHNLEKALALLQQSSQLQLQRITLEEENAKKLEASLRAEIERKQAEGERQRTEAQKTEEYRLLRTTEQARVALLVAISEQANEILKLLPLIFDAIMAIREWQEEASERLEQLERGVILIIADKSDVELAARMATSEQRSSLRRQLADHLANLNRLKEEKARAGFNLAIENQINREQVEIGKINEELSDG